VENGGEGQANDCAEEEYGEEDLMKCELFVQREHLQDEGIHPGAAAASTSPTKCMLRIASAAKRAHNATDGANDRDAETRTSDCPG
jgi:hypothetical protein